MHASLQQEVLSFVGLGAGVKEGIFSLWSSITSFDPKIMQVGPKKWKKKKKKRRKEKKEKAKKKMWFL
jgi:hypothetical protein